VAVKQGRAPPMPFAAMRSQNGSSLVAVLATLLIIGGLAAAALPALLHPSSKSRASGAPAPTAQGTVDAARNAVQTINAQQQGDTDTP
jgi:type II secretory pathway pseudopilin PulG